MTMRGEQVKVQFDIDVTGKSSVAANPPDYRCLQRKTLQYRVGRAC